MDPKEFVRLSVPEQIALATARTSVSPWPHRVFFVLFVIAEVMWVVRFATTGAIPDEWFYLGWLCLLAGWERYTNIGFRRLLDRKDREIEALRAGAPATPSPAPVGGAG